jgi:hypothetical protein
MENIQGYRHHLGIHAQSFATTGGCSGFFATTGPIFNFPILSPKHHLYKSIELYKLVKVRILDLGFELALFNYSPKHHAAWLFRWYPHDRFR